MDGRLLAQASIVKSSIDYNPCALWSTSLVGEENVSEPTWYGQCYLICFAG